MRVARLHAAGDVRLHDEEPEALSAGRAVVRVESVGLCGSDLHWFTEGGIGDACLTRPLVLGHEIAGTVQGGQLDGRLVALDPALPCGRCETCRVGLGHLCPHVVFAGHGLQDGGLRQEMPWPVERLHALPEGMSAEDGAVLEPLGVALHAADLAHLRPGGSSAVVGCGPIGLILVSLLRVAGAGLVVAVEPLEHRRAAALAAGADLVLTPDTARDGGLLEATGPVGVDVAFEMAGSNSAVDLALRAARPGGRVVLVGIPDDDTTTFTASLARRKGLTVMLSRRMGQVYPRSIELVRRGVVDPGVVVSHRFGLDDVRSAFTAAASRDGLKVLVGPWIS